VLLKRTEKGIGWPILMDLNIVINQCWCRELDVPFTSDSDFGVAEHQFFVFAAYYHRELFAKWTAMPSSHFVHGSTTENEYLLEQLPVNFTLRKRLKDA
jgi:hypothetical protein